MWLEIKIGVNIISWVLIGYVCSRVILLNLFMGVFLIAAIVISGVSDFIIGYAIASNHVDVLIDGNPAGHETVILCDFGGNVDFAQVKKAPFGKREFVRYGKEASVINRGKYPIRLPNGNHGFIAHENLDLDVDMVEAEALDKLEGDDIKEIVENLEDKEKLEKVEGGVLND